MKVTVTVDEAAGTFTVVATGSLALPYGPTGHSIGAAVQRMLGQRELELVAEDSVDCPVEDPSCEGSDEQCHDACEPSAEHAAAIRDAKLRARALRLLDDQVPEQEVANRLSVPVEQVLAWDYEQAGATPPTFGTAEASTSRGAR